MNPLGASPMELPQPTVEESRDWGRHVQRTMALLSGSTPEKPNTVRILFYGQSIMESRWSDEVVDWLRTTYPHAIIESENRSIGGFAAQFLIRVAEHDLYSFQPDLLVFHVYGSHEAYEEILHNVRSRTIAEVMLMTDHYKASDHDGRALTMSQWDRFMERFLAAAADKYACERVDVRTAWRGYLERHNLLPASLLADNIHLNESGKHLMAALCKQHLRVLPGHVAAAEPVQVIDGSALVWKQGRARLTFQGNRVDFLSKNPPGGEAQVLVNGRPPGDTPELFTFTRPSGIIHPKSWPTLMRVSSQTTPIAEDWRLEILEVSEDHKTLRFRITGSRTGEDGEGISTQPFVSKSGRITIDPADWTVARSHATTGDIAKVGMASSWSCVPMFGHMEARCNPPPATLLSGLPNATHQIEFVADDPLNPPRIQQLHVYRPPLLAGRFEPMGMLLEPQDESLDQSVFRPQLPAKD